MTKKFHRCDERCEPAGTGIHHDKTVDIRSKVTVKTKRTPTPSRVKEISNVYSPDYSNIDNTIEDIKTASRGISINYYSTNNVYVILQDALKRVRLADK